MFESKFIIIAMYKRGHKLHLSLRYSQLAVSDSNLIKSTAEGALHRE